MTYPKVLVISNNSFSLTNSNGRTLGNYFIDWPKECIAQFFISTDGPNFDICNNYYNTSDLNILHSFLKFNKCKGTVINSKQDFTLSLNNSYLGKKNSFKALIRHVLWSNKRWESNHFKKWLLDFSPEVILLQSGDSAFMLSLATHISNKLKVPLIIYNSEGYYFFKKSYMDHSLSEFLFYPIYKKIYKRQFKKTMSKASHIIYLNSKLKNDYDAEFPNVQSTVIYSSSILKPSNIAFKSINPTFSYLGNFGKDRHLALLTIADTLQSIDSNYKLNIYGKISDPKIIKTFVSHKGINFHGQLKYDKVLDIINNSDILFHAESQNEKWRESLKYGFSTKIADSLASGKCLIIFSAREIACAEYVIHTSTAWVSTDSEKLRETIVNIINNSALREEVLSNAREISFRNHNMVSNREKFKKLLYLTIYN